MTTLYNIKDNSKASQFWIHLSLILWYSTSVHLSKKGFFPCQAILTMKDGLFCLGSQQLHHKYLHFSGPCVFPFASQYEEPHSFTRCSLQPWGINHSFFLLYLLHLLSLRSRLIQLGEGGGLFQSSQIPVLLLPLFSKDQQATQTQSPRTPLIDNFS